MNGELRDAKRIFDPTLFWDAEKIDAERHVNYVNSEEPRFRG